MFTTINASLCNLPLKPDSTYYIQINGLENAVNTNYCISIQEIPDTTQILGCTDSLAVNFNPCATENDLTCLYIGNNCPSAAIEFGYAIFNNNEIEFTSCPCDAEVWCG